MMPRQANTLSVAATPARTQIDVMRSRGVRHGDVIDTGCFALNPTTSLASDHFPYFATVFSFPRQLVPEPPALTLVGACGGLVVAARRPLLGATRSTAGDGPITPPAAKDGLGGRSPEARAAFWPGSAGRQEMSAVAPAARQPRSVLACRRGASEGQHTS